MRTLIKGSYGESNFGDDLLMCTLEQFFIDQYPTSEVVFWGDVSASYCEKLLKRSMYLTRYDFPKLNKNNQFDLFVFGGGTQFYSFNLSSSKFRKLMRLFRLFLNIRELVKKVRHRMSGRVKFDDFKFKLKFAIGIGIGPFDQDNKSQFAKQSLGLLDFIGVRDEVSMKYCSEWGLEKSVLGADICFSDYFYKLGVIPKSLLKVNQKSKNKKIGIIVRDWVHDKLGASYYEPLIDAINRNSKENLDFTFIVFAPDRDPMWMELINRNNFNYDVWNPYIDTLEDFMERFNEFDGFISARYHGAVVASLLNKPTICIEIEPKLKIITQQIPEFKLWTNNFDIDELYSHFNMFFGDFDCSASVSSLNMKSNKMFDAVSANILKL